MQFYPIPFVNLEYIYYSILKAVFGGLSGDIFVIIYKQVSSLAELIVPYSVFISLILLVGIIYCLIRIKQIERDLILAKTPISKASAKFGQSVNTRWQRILTHINSDNQSDWRLAILEADMILGEMLTSMGYHGETIGEQLQGIEKSDFRYLDEAWEAHRIRNKIAHEGLEYELSRREAHHTISLFEKVFSEFKFI